MKKANIRAFFMTCSAIALVCEPIGKKLSFFQFIQQLIRPFRLLMNGYFLIDIFTIPRPSLAFLLPPNSIFWFSLRISLQLVTKPIGSSG